MEASERFKTLGALVTVAVAVACLSAYHWSVALSAPVPKRPPADADRLTAAKVAATWDYAWGGFPDGVITFDKDGSYTAQHVVGSNTLYAGSWKLEGDTVTITEWSYDAATGALRGGPCDYAFDFKGSKCPNLTGVSNGATSVALSNPRK